jgi:hypothetical protein
MTWLPLLLADPSPCLRWLALRDLFHSPAHDPELEELAPQSASDPLAAETLAQNDDGSWQSARRQIRMTAFALTRLGYLGFDNTFLDRPRR